MTFYDHSHIELGDKERDFHKLGYTLMNYVFPINQYLRHGVSGNEVLKMFRQFCVMTYPSDSIFKVIELLIRQLTEDWKEMYREMGIPEEAFAVARKLYGKKSWCLE